MRITAKLRALERATRPYDTEFAAAMERRWAELPDAARTPGQILGRHGVGCEGTHGVFPKCNLKCTPCYHSRDANQVRVDGPTPTNRSPRRCACCANCGAHVPTPSSSAARSACSPPTTTPQPSRSCGTTAGNR